MKISAFHSREDIENSADTSNKVGSISVYDIYGPISDSQIENGNIY